ncbi:MAG: LEA type 2 family protein [Gemmatimonadetes bacterium]|nr:LEA type 2 family protein [Gemmatimonadota bacterium]
MVKPRSIVLVALTLGLAACLHGFKRPEIRLAGLRFGGIGLRGGLVYTKLEVTNPNGFELRANRVRYNLQLRDPDDPSKLLPLAEGTFDQDVRVPGHSTTTVEIPVEFGMGSAGAAVQSVLNRGTLSYRVTGDVELTRPVDTTVPFRHEGVVSLAGAQ